ncbi:hypothetical protein [Kribbella endophytica]
MPRRGRAVVLFGVVTALLLPLLQTTAAAAAQVPAADPTPPAKVQAAKPTPPKQATPRRSATQTEACGAAITWYTVFSCSAIGAHEQDTFTLPAVGPGDKLLIRLGYSGEASVGARLVGPDGSQCSAGSGNPGECPVPVAGDYTIVVDNNYGTGSYLLSVASIRTSACTQLTAADLSATSPGLPGELESGVVADCYQFGGAPDDVVQLGAGTGITTVYDAAGGEICAPRYADAFDCTMSGPAPYRAFVADGHHGGPTYTLRLARLTGETGCPALAVAPFGPTDGALATGSLAAYDATCRSITLEAGLHSIRLAPANNAGLQIYDPAGRTICRDDVKLCDVPASGKYTAMISNHDYPYEPIDYTLAVTALAGTRGCAAETDTRWDLPLLTKTTTSALQLDCQPVKAVAGQRLMVRSPVVTWGSEPHLDVVAGDGSKACALDERGQCTLAGTGPFRILSSSGGPDEYQIEIGSLTDAVGCTPLVLTTFGAVPAPAPDGSRCRELVVDSPATYLIRSGDTQGQGSTSGKPAYGADGQAACDNLERCALQAGRYIVVLPADARIAAFPATETRGCTTQSADGFVSKSGTITDGSQVDCLQLSAPAGATVVPVEPANAVATSGLVLDATGAEMCLRSLDDNPCKLVGTAPFRALIRNRDYAQPSAYRLAMPRIDSAAGCKPFPQGDFTTVGGTAVSTREDRFGECFALGTTHAAVEAVQFSRTAGAGTARLDVIGPDGNVVCDLARTAVGFTPCHLDQGKSYTAVLGASADSSAFQVARRDVTGAAKGCLPVGSTAIGATSASSTIDGSVLRCHKVAAAAADRFLVNTRDAHGSSAAAVFGADGASVCQTYASVRCLASGSTSYQVIAWNDASVGAPGPYKLEMAKLGGAAGPAADCPKIASSAYGFGPLTGELTASRTTACVAVPVKKYDQLTGAAVNQVAGPAPDFTGYSPKWQWNCMGGGPGEEYSCNAAYDENGHQLILVSLPETQTAALKYRLSMTCTTPLCGSATFGVTGATPASAVSGTTATLTLKGQSLHLKDVVRLTAAGQAAITGTVKSVSADRTTATVAFALGTAPAGARDVVVTSFSGPVVTLAKAFTVTPKPLVVVKAPFLVAPVRVGAVVKADPGTWSPAATSAKYQWRNDGVVIAGATANSYTPPAGMLLHKLSVTVTVSRAGSASTTLTSAAVTVARGAAPVVTKAPAITGTVQAKHTVGVSVGTWSPACTTYAYQWYSGGAAVSGATKSTLLLTTAMAKKALWVAVACGRTGHDSGRALSASVTVRA